jgi:DNA-binding NarL/FixJ family response regulator
MLAAMTAHTYDLSLGAFERSLRLMWPGGWGFSFGLAVRQNEPAQASDNELRDCGAQLSPDEREVLLQVIEGHANKVIAQRLGITEASVKVHLNNLLRKIKVENRTQATIWALANLPELTTG